MLEYYFFCLLLRLQVSLPRVLDWHFSPGCNSWVCSPLDPQSKRRLHRASTQAKPIPHAGGWWHTELFPQPGMGSMLSLFLAGSREFPYATELPESAAFLGSRSKAAMAKIIQINARCISELFFLSVCTLWIQAGTHLIFCL